jgi:GntR family transcriptional regulator / MocR family aminotransferase
MLQTSRRALPALLIRLDPNAAAPMYAQIYGHLREAILSGKFPAGTRLPSTRALAADLRISRNTVLIAFEQLVAEGYLEGRAGSSTRVARQLPDDLLRVRSAAAKPRNREQRAPVSKRGQAILDAPSGPASSGAEPKAFRPHRPALDRFPTAVWAKLMSQVWQKNGEELMGIGLPEGYYPLRREIATYVGAARGVRCEPDQVVITEGSQQALDLCARLLLDPGDPAIVEEPGYLGARTTLVAAGARLLPVAVDENGIDVDAVALHTDARLVYLTPSHQYPLGPTLCLARRLAILEWARQSGAWIVEDDYDSEFRYEGRPVAALQGLDSHGRTIYVGTFSKVLAPGLRIGYLILPPGLVDLFIAGRRLTCGHAAMVEQAVLAEFLAQGHFARHVRRMRLVYQDRQKSLLESAARHLPAGILEMVPRPCGMNVLARLAPGLKESDISTEAAKHGLELVGLAPYYLRKPRAQAFLLGFAALDAQPIDDGMRRLARVLKA